MIDSNLLKKIKILANIENGSINHIISNYIINNTELILNLTLEQLALNCNTSKASVLRFCIKIGLEGYNELRFKIKDLLQNSNNKTNNLFISNHLLEENNNWYQFYNDIKKESSNQTMKMYSERYINIKLLIKKIMSAKCIYIFAMNLAYNTSRNFVQRIRWINKNVIHERDLNSIDSYVQILDPEDVVLIISLSGESRFLKKIANDIADEKKCFVYGILGAKKDIFQFCNDYFLLPTKENELWDIFSIRSQCLIQFLDYLYVDLIGNNVFT